jgi:hypothetical protein
MCLVSLGRTLKEELRENHEKRFSGYTRRPLSPSSMDVTTLKLYARLFGLLKEHVTNPLVKTQSPIRNSFAAVGTDEKEVLVVGDTVCFQRIPASCMDDGMWMYLQPDTLTIVFMCCDGETRDRFLAYLQDPEQRFELAEIWSH